MRAREWAMVRGQGKWLRCVLSMPNTKRLWGKGRKAFSCWSIISIASKWKESFHNCDQIFFCKLCYLTIWKKGT
jgi:hypothetical protein